jgi:hypothetical protein
VFEQIEGSKVSKRSVLAQIALSALYLLLGILWLALGHEFLGYAFIAVGVVGLVLGSVRWKRTAAVAQDLAGGGKGNN